MLEGKNGNGNGNRGADSLVTRLTSSPHPPQAHHFVKRPSFPLLFPSLLWRSPALNTTNMSHQLQTQIQTLWILYVPPLHVVRGHGLTRGFG